MNKCAIARCVAGAAALGLLALTGCSSLSTHTVQYIGAPRYARSTAANVDILQREIGIAIRYRPPLPGDQKMRPPQT